MANEGYLDKIAKEDVKQVEEDLFILLDAEYKAFCDKMIKGKITDEIKAEMHKICEKVIAKF